MYSASCTCRSTERRHYDFGGFWFCGVGPNRRLGAACHRRLGAACHRRLGALVEQTRLVCCRDDDSNGKPQAHARQTCAAVSTQLAHANRAPLSCSTPNPNAQHPPWPCIRPSIVLTALHPAVASFDVDGMDAMIVSNVVDLVDGQWAVLWMLVVSPADSGHFSHRRRHNNDAKTAAPTRWLQVRKLRYLDSAKSMGFVGECFGSQKQSIVSLPSPIARWVVCSPLGCLFAPMISCRSCQSPSAEMAVCAELCVLPYNIVNSTHVPTHVSRMPDTLTHVFIHVLIQV